MKLTNEQIKAITVPQSKEERTNVLVSAGAGAGKTFVLIERIAKLLEVCDLDELLVLTFTNQAAASMKEKLRAKLEEDKSLRKYLEKIDNAKIMTFDAYSLFLVKKYHLKLGLDPNVQIMDEYYKKTKLREIISEVLAEYYKENNEILKRYFKEDLIRDDDTLINDLERLYYTLDKKVDTLGFIENYKLNFYTKENLNDLKNLYIKLLNSFIEEEKTNLQMLASYLDYKREVLEEIGRDEGNLDDDLIKWMNKVLPYVNKTSSYEKLKEVFSYQIPARSRKGNNIIQTELVNKAISEIRTTIQKSNMQKKEFVSFEDEADIIESIIYEKDYIFLFLEMMEKIINKYSLYKAKYNVYDFSDIAKLAIKLVKENDDIRDEIKNSLYEILIDEYQDTSDLQEDFINLIS
ncbi:MAG TPA: UvrD-helicase domain-containing protein, partial [Acholeplasma sp.]|nr:UvrD-helicase domain-containing protein [Acholeplasma sp.]